MSPLNSSAGSSPRLAESDPILVPLSALQHYVYCPRQCGLIHVEQVFDENIFTLRGTAAHERVDLPESDYDESVRVERALPLFCDSLGLTGRADVVEFLPDGTPYPVEYKLGTKRDRDWDNVQLAAQALCLEEMTGRSVPRGAIYHHRSKRRREVVFDDRLRQLVIATATAVRKMLVAQVIAAPIYDQKCTDCSLIELCQPRALANRQRHATLMQELFQA